MTPPTRTVMWFRRDLRLADNPALLDACAADGVLPLYVLDPALWDPAGPSRRGYLAASLRSLDAAFRQRQTRLSVLRGDPVRQVLRAARAVRAERVHVAADFGPYGSRRDRAVAEALAEHDIELVRTGSPYAVAPGRVRNGSGDPYKVYTPFSKAWSEHGWRDPVEAPTGVGWLGPEDLAQGPQGVEGVEIPDPALPEGLTLPEAGERAARSRWQEYLDEGLADYRDHRDRPDLDATSHMSVHLKWGEIHPRTMLADLRDRGGPGTATYRKELAWREFYADVLHHRPETAREYLRPEFAAMEYDEPGAALTAWQEGRTGYPVVDAGMRQLRATGWMHNRVRMIVASFLVKDLHVEWQHGARHFMHWLVDGDLASNQHGWQWVAGSGTDASPYFRVFNPTTQGRKFDPDGVYVRRWLPELADLGPDVDPHEPGDVPGYPAPIIDHATERREALARLEKIKQ
ncbi:cryptochrome/photolyase family protein [Nocardioides donggukensis]|uniref:Deoxyribodipyrimidine photo-lyase n=1 Tax=Nocardioides donggukensis TaxID=2774019 RepID=A0A927K7R0_9ACTN|nr:deoxyribodipyrimidine photo-lyase [Nocardioides donggukensis]MBD8870710.1 deoxyribodipyrimidine photo-lyase [Nocardioides donggukensis]